MTNVSLVQFPGSNCDLDCIAAMDRYFNLKVTTVWHTEAKLPKTDFLIIPGGFSFGDYIRSGSLASHSMIMTEVKKFADGGGYIIGICNGFQILTEAAILPGALLANNTAKFICQFVQIKSPDDSTIYRIPIAHGEGRYYIDENGLKKLHSENLIAYQYCNLEGIVAAEANPNGSLDGIAGIYSENKRVLGLMPHPERAVDKILGTSDDGIKIWQHFFKNL